MPRKFHGHTLSERQLTNINKKIVTDASGCMLWSGYINEEGYGLYSAVRVHRLMLERRLGRPIAEGMLACHTCTKHRNCVNAEHLYEGSACDNMRDMKLQGTLPDRRGKPNKKLTDDQVRAIRADTRGSYEIAADHGVDASYIRALRRGKYRRAATPTTESDTPDSGEENASSPSLSPPSPSVTDLPC